MKKNTPTYARIELAARCIADDYLETLQDGKLPPLLAALVEYRKGDILDTVADNRIKNTNALSEVKRLAHFCIRHTLDRNPELCEKLAALRRSERLRREAALAAKSDNEKKSDKAFVAAEAAAAKALELPTSKELEAAAETLRKAANAVGKVKGFVPLLGDAMVKALFSDAGRYAALLKLYVELAEKG